MRPIHQLPNRLRLSALMSVCLSVCPFVCRTCLVRLACKWNCHLHYSGGRIHRWNAYAQRALIEEGNGSDEAFQSDSAVAIIVWDQLRFNCNFLGNANLTNHEVIFNDEFLLINNIFLLISYYQQKIYYLFATFFKGNYFTELYKKIPKRLILVAQPSLASTCVNPCMSFHCHLPPLHIAWCSETHHKCCHQQLRAKGRKRSALAAYTHI